jgi:hypothetical protein
MEAGRTEWTDKRLDGEFAQITQRFDRVESRLDDLQKTMIIGFISMCTMMFAGFGAILTLFAAHF